MKEKSVLMSPPTRERVLGLTTLLSPLFVCFTKPELKKSQRPNVAKYGLNNSAINVQFSKRPNAYLVPSAT